MNSVKNTESAKIYKDDAISTLKLIVGKHGVEALKLISAQKIVLELIDMGVSKEDIDSALTKDNKD